jgi:hypothetical protein
VKYRTGCCLLIENGKWKIESGALRCNAEKVEKLRSSDSIRFLHFADATVEVTVLLSHQHIITSKLLQHYVKRAMKKIEMVER